MTSYNRVKATTIAPVGTIMPWGGGSRFGENMDNIPNGWIICNQQNQVLNAAQYPLLAAVLGNQYGPFPEPGDGNQLGTNFGIVNPFPYNDDEAVGYVDKFGLPNLNQLALVDIEKGRDGTGNNHELTPNDLLLIGNFFGLNGPDADIQPATLIEADVDITFTVEPSDSLAGRITGITMDDPIYFDTVYVIPRKLGIEHMPGHGHRAASTADFDQYWSAFAAGNGVMEFLPGKASKDQTKYTSVSAIGHKGDDSQAHTFRPGLKNITWYDANDGGISLPLGNQRQFIDASTALIPAIPSDPRQITERSYYPGENLGYSEDNRAMANIQVQAHTGAFPPAGYYNGARNYYASPDIPAFHRGSGMPSSYVNDVAYDSGAGEKQPINTAVTDTYYSTLNHGNERWADDGLKSHTHDAMEITMSRGGLSIPSTVLVNNISTGTTSPVSVDTALSVTMNPNTPSLTMLYIIRAF